MNIMIKQDKEASPENCTEMNDFFKQLATFEQSLLVTPLEQRRQFHQKEAPSEELQEVHLEVKEIESALSRACEIARYAIEQFDDLMGRYQKTVIELEDTKQSNTMIEEQKDWNADELLKANSELEVIKEISQK